MRSRPPLLRIRALALAAAVLAPSVLVAQAEPGWAPPAAPAALAAAAIAERWGIEPGQVRIEWGTVRSGESVPAEAGVRLVGSGAAGSWVVVFAAGDAEAHVRARAGVERPAATAARDIERGETLREEDVAFAPILRWGPPSGGGDDAVAGWVAQRRIGAGERLEPPAVSRPDAVRAGDAVRIVWSRGAVQLTLPGRAAGSAALGERVAVRADTGKRFYGFVQAGGVVRIEAGPATK